MQAARDLQAQRFLLEEDVATYIADAERKVADILAPPPPKQEPGPGREKKALHK
jgi:hypothetical protein